ncbi:Alpha-N-arabinofuranosidase [Orbilia brochopaga]|nr:Alpha-N-arabinofuranosidase [Drechslerella brochopaga]
MHSIHIYTADKEHMPNVVAPLSAERAIEVTASLIDLARINNRFTYPPSSDSHITHKPNICFDEWNVWMPTRAPGDEGAEEAYTLSDALAVGVWLNVFVRQAKHLGMANIAQSVNVISPLMTTKSGIVKQTTYFVLYLFANYMQGKTLGVHLTCGTYKGRTTPDWISTTMDVPWLDVSGAISDDGFINLSVVNASEDDDILTDVSIPEKTEVMIFRIGGGKFNVTDTNMKGQEIIKIQEDTWIASSKFNFEKRSYTLLRWKSDSIVPGSLNFVRI